MRAILDYYLLTDPADAPEVYDLLHVLEQDQIDAETAEEQRVAERRLEELIEKQQGKQ